MTSIDRDPLAPYRGELTRRRLLGNSLLAGAGLSLSGLVAACADDDDQAGTAQGDAGEPQPGGRVAFGIAGAPNETANPYILLTGSGSARAFATYDALTRLAGEEGDVEPWLAESLEPSSDLARWQIKLQSGVQFHNGKELTSEDVLYSLRWVIDPKNGADRQAALEPVIDIGRSRAVDRSTVDLVLKAPNANLPLVLASFVFIMPAGTTSFDPPIGTGPFKFDSWRRGTSTQLVKNRQWWKSNLPYLDELEIVNIADSQARLNALQGSQVDIISGLDFTQAKALEGNSGAKLLRTPGSRCIPFYMRLDYPAFEDNRARTAFKLAVDRQELVDNVLLGYGSVANDMFGAGYPSYPDDVEQREYDPEKAKSLLAAAGQSDVAVTLTTSKVVPGMLEAATAYAQQAKEAGIRIKLQEVPADQYWTGQYFLKVPFAQEDWSERFELTAELALLSDAPFNETVWKRPDFDRRFVEAGQTADEGQRADIYKELQREVWAEGGYIIWGYQDVLDAAKPGVNGIKVVRNRTLGNYDFSEIWLS